MKATVPQYYDYLLFTVLPYATLMVFLIGSIYRYVTRKFSYSTISSQFLENRQHFWAVVPFHFGILFLFAGHLTAFLVPSGILWWNSVPARLYILEISALTAGIFTIISMTAVIWRRLTVSKVRVGTSPADWVVYGLLLVQCGLGVYTAIYDPWGSSWFAAIVAPYLASIFTLNPDITAVAALPWTVKLHFLGALLIFFALPFTRLVHILVIPNPYLWRRPQVVRWNYDRRKIRPG